MSIRYKASFGSYQTTNEPKDGQRLLLKLNTELGMDSISGVCGAELLGAEFEPIQLGEAVKVELDTGEGFKSVFKGQVVDNSVTANTQQILALDDVSKLSHKSCAISYEKVTLDFIIKDLISKAGGKVGKISKGPEVPFYAIHNQPSMLRQLHDLAEYCGADIYCTGDGKIQVCTPQEKNTEHSFELGKTIANLQLRENALPYDSVEVWGEGAGSAQGETKSHWLCADINGVCGKASLDKKGKVQMGKLGQYTRYIYLGALRTGAAAEAVAKAYMNRLATRRLSGTLEVYGAAAVMPGDTLKLEKLPKEHSATALFKQGYKLRVRTVRHRLDRERGLVTQLEC